MKMGARLKEIYLAEIVPLLRDKFSYSSAMEVPKIEKVTINIGLGAAINDKKLIDYAVSDLSKISGQKPIVSLARKSIAGFKLREGNAIGCKVTLRKERMYEFLDRFISISIPRIRDFRGMNPNSFDGRGNFTLGIKEQIIFPEIEYDKIDSIRGMNITITTSAKSDDEARELIRAFNFPFKK